MRPKMKIGEKAIDEISQIIHSGMIAYINRENFDVVFIPDDKDHMMSDGKEIWKVALNTVESWENPIVIEKMESWKAFQIMKDFIEILSDHQMQAKLEIALEKRRPFAHFKAIVETSEYRQMWFDYRDERHISYVRKNLPSGILPDIKK